MLPLILCNCCENVARSVVGPDLGGDGPWIPGLLLSSVGYSVGSFILTLSSLIFQPTTWFSKICFNWLWSRIILLMVRRWLWFLLSSRREAYWCKRPALPLQCSREIGSKMNRTSHRRLLWDWMGTHDSGVYHRESGPPSYLDTDEDVGWGWSLSSSV